MPRPAALRAKSAVRSGERCAEVTSISYAIPNSSSALPASRMISRSESLPITIETSVLLIAPSLKVFFWPVVLAVKEPAPSEAEEIPFTPTQPAASKEISATTYFFNARAAMSLRVVCSLKADLRASFVSTPDCRLQIARPRRHSQHPSARSVVSAIAIGSARVEHLHTLDGSCLLESVDSLSHLIRPRIPP